MLTSTTEGQFSTIFRWSVPGFLWGLKLNSQRVLVTNSERKRDSCKRENSDLPLLRGDMFSL